MVKVGRTLGILGKWSANRILGKKRPLVAVFSLTHYCNFYCPMCPFGDSDKEGQLKLVKNCDLTTQQWKNVFEKTAKYCVWSIIEGGEPTSRPDFIELVRHLNYLKLPVSLITNCSLLHKIDLDELKKYIQFVTCSIDSVYEEPYCKIRGVPAHLFERVMQNLFLLKEKKIPYYFNSVITKYNTDEFIDGSYFERAANLGVNSVSLTFVEDRSDVNYSLLPQKQVIQQVCQSILKHIESGRLPKLMIPAEYFEQILRYGHTMFEECGIWKSVFVNANGTVLVPCWKFNKPENTYNIVEKSIEEIWDAPQWEIAKKCHDCQMLGCIWYSSQPITAFAKNYMMGLSKMIASNKVQPANTS